jgi:8-oxo-dGTP pyrophosphatase MutT (NUDIX family)
MFYDNSERIEYKGRIRNNDFVPKKCNSNQSASGKYYNGQWVWKEVNWSTCECGLWHSNRFIPNNYWNQYKNAPKLTNRKKAGVIVIRNFSEVWITQSYNKCYGFPKGEKEKYETIEECAKREFYEETGHSINEVDLSKYITLSMYIEEVEYIFYIMNVGSSFNIQTFPVDDVEITSFGWVKLRDIFQLKVSKSVKLAIKLYTKQFLDIFNK